MTVTRYYDSNGKKHGNFDHHYPNKQLQSRTPFVHGVIHGDVDIYYENGQLRNRTPYIQGERHGIQKIYDKNGQEISESIYVHDKKIRIDKISEYQAMKQIFEKETILPLIENSASLPEKEEIIQSPALTVLQEPASIIRKYYPNGQLKYARPLDADGQQHGDTLGYYESGRLRYKHPYNHGKPHGQHFGFYDDDNGRPRYEHNYEDGKLHGYCIGNYSHGRALLIFPYKHGELHGVGQFIHFTQKYVNLAIYINNKRIFTNNFDCYKTAEETFKKLETTQPHKVETLKFN